jgi:hypothetical protein
MSVMLKLANSLGVSSDIPNQSLAKELAQAEDAIAIAELTAGFESSNKAVQSDCIKVLYEIGYLKPELITCYASLFLKLLQSRNNRVVWGAMIALSTIAGLAEKEISERLDLVYKAMGNGSVITVDNGVRVLARIAAVIPERSSEIAKYLLRHLGTCRASEIPQHAESSLPAVNSENKDAFINVLKAREVDMTPAQMKRIKKVYKELEYR